MAAGEITSPSSVTGQLMNGKTIAGLSNTYSKTGILTAIERTVLVPITTAIVLFAINATVNGQTIPALNGFKCKNEGTTLVYIGIKTGTKSAFIPVAPNATFELTSAFLDVNTDDSALGTPTAVTSITAVSITTANYMSYIAY